MPTSSTAMICIFLILFASCAADSLLNSNEPCDSEIEFPCDSEGCVRKGWWCDGSTDCEDESDEMYCLSSSAPNCTSLHFKCRDGSCIPMSGRCDGKSSCKDHSDELHCDEKTGEKSELHISPSGMQYDVKLEQADLTSFVVDERMPDTSFPTRQLQSPVPSERSADDSKFSEIRDKATQCILSRMDEWGDEAPRAVISLYLANSSYFRNSSHDSAIIVKNLHVQLAMELLRNNTNPMSLSTLSHFINALLATCNDPRNFHGQNLVKILRERTDVAQRASFVNPFVYLTLCINGESTALDLSETRHFFSASKNPRRLDILSLAILSTACMAGDSRSRSYYAHEGLLSISPLEENNFNNNVYKSALLVQALDLVEVRGTRWESLKTEALNYLLQQQDIDGCFGDHVANYYAMAVVSGNKLDSLKQGCDQVPIGSRSIEVTAGSTITAQYSLYIGNGIEMSHSLQLTIPVGSSLFDIMELAATEDSLFDFKYDLSRGYPAVYAIGSHPNDAEQGAYWFLYKKLDNSSDNSFRNMQPVTTDITKILMKNGDHYVNWFKLL